MDAAATPPEVVGGRETMGLVIGTGTTYKWQTMSTEVVYMRIDLHLHFSQPRAGAGARSAEQLL